MPSDAPVPRIGGGIDSQRRLAGWYPVCEVRGDTAVRDVRHPNGYDRQSLASERAGERATLTSQEEEGGTVFKLVLLEPLRASDAPLRAQAQRSTPGLSKQRFHVARHRPALRPIA